MNVKTQRRSAVGSELVADIGRDFGEVCLRVTGSSMIPAIWPGDVVTVRRCEIAALQRGQIVLSRREGKLVAHRIVWIGGDSFITRGDSLLHDDPPLEASEIVGAVVSIVRNCRRVRLRQSIWQRASSVILRRSDFCLRMTLRLSRRLRRRGGREISWAN